MKQPQRQSTIGGDGSGGGAGATVLVMALAVLVATAVASQEPPRPAAPGTEPTEQDAGAGAEGGRPRRADSPQEAYRTGDYARAAEGFRRRSDRDPDDPRHQLNLGSALHRLEDYAGAESAFQTAAEVTEERRTRAKALYNLGNTEYRQGRLEAAVERYREALELVADDQDAKFNLEFVQREIERRREQAQQRQSSPDQEQDPGQQPSDEEQDGEDGQEGGEQDGSEGEQDDGEGSAGDDGAGDRDTDGDGLSDEIEQRGDNPTDPRSPDTDGDGRSDGEEDRNRNGRRDPGESDPNVPDQAPSGPGGESSEDGSAEARAQQQGEMSHEEAERLLAALQDRRPAEPRQEADAATRKSTKDW